MLGIEQIGDRPIGQQRLDRRQLAAPEAAGGRQAPPALERGHRGHRLVAVAAVAAPGRQAQRGRRVGDPRRHRLERALDELSPKAIALARPDDRAARTDLRQGWDPQVADGQRRADRGPVDAELDEERADPGTEQLRRLTGHRQEAGAR
jgi:hypothetical protein